VAALTRLHARHPDKPAALLITAAFRNQRVQERGAEELALHSLEDRVEVPWRLLCSFAMMRSFLPPPRLADATPLQALGTLSPWSCVRSSE
jgi:hypothetical protein